MQQHSWLEEIFVCVSIILTIRVIEEYYEDNKERINDIIVEYMLALP